MIAGKEYLKILLKFWEYRSGQFTALLEQQLKKLYGDKQIFLLGNGRSAQYLFLKSLDLPKDSNIIIQSFTCNAVVNPVLWLNLEPRYVDIDPNNYSLSIEDLKRKIDSNTKVIVLQHTFGITGPIDEVMQIARSNGILVLEDCAHSLGNMTTGTKGDAALLSFGIEKVLATRAGGALVVNNAKLAEKVAAEYKKLRTMGFLETFVWLLNPLFWRVLRVLGPVKYSVARFIRKLKLLNMGFEDPELLGRMPKAYPKRLSNALSKFAYMELMGLEENLAVRRNAVKMYEKLLGRRLGDTPLVRYPYLMESFSQVNELTEMLAKRGFSVGDWYRPVVYPASTNLASMKYVVGSCPVAEMVSKRIVNLPTGSNVTRSQAEVYANAISSVINRE
jgi:dTDP-4-amino-4,6-dideoxygalactose transaminase